MKRKPAAALLRAELGEPPAAEPPPLPDIVPPTTVPVGSIGREVGELRARVRELELALAIAEARLIDFERLGVDVSAARLRIEGVLGSRSV